MENKNNAKIKYVVRLTLREKAELNQLTKKGNHKARKMKRAFILLNCDVGGNEEQTKPSDESIAKSLGVSVKTVERTKKRFVQDGFQIALEGKPSSREYKTKLDGDAEAHLIALSCSTPPEGFSRWSIRLLADKMVELKYVDSIGRETVRQTLKKTN
jgi:hypothetical protein